MATAKEVLFELSNDAEFQNLTDSEQDTIATQAIERFASSEPVSPKRQLGLQERALRPFMTGSTEQLTLGEFAPEIGVTRFDPNILGKVPALGTHPLGIPVALGLSAMNPKELVADVAEFTGEQLPTLGQLAGGAAGAATGSLLGPVGSIGGATIGGATGAGLVKAGMLGLGDLATGINQQDKLPEIESEMALGAMEGLGPLAKEMGSFALSKHPIIKSALSKFLSSTSGVSKESVQTLLTEGAENVTKATNLAADAIPKFGTKVHNAFRKVLKTAGSEFESVEKFIRADTERTITTTNIKTVLKDRLAQLGMVDPNSGEFLWDEVKGETKQFLMKAYNKLSPEFGKVSKQLEDLPAHLKKQALSQLKSQTADSLTYNQAFKLLDEADEILDGINKGSYVVHKKTHAAVAQLRSELSTALKNPALGGSREYANAAAKIKPYLEARDALGGSLVTSKNAVRNVRGLEKAEFTDTKNAIDTVLNLMPGKSATNLKRQMAMLKAADEVHDLTLRSFRASLLERVGRTVAGPLIGGSTLGPAGAILGLTLSSPRLMAEAIKLTQRGGKAFLQSMKISGSAGRVIAPAATRNGQ